MVEYAILVAGTALRSLGNDVSRITASLNWTYIGYAAFLLIVMRFVVWALRPGR